MIDSKNRMIRIRYKYLNPFNWGRKMISGLLKMLSV